MINAFEIRRFKCFEHLRLDPLGRVTLLGGRNNVGKTTVLEALFMFLDRLNPNMVIRQYALRGVSSIPLVPESVFLPIFTGYNSSSPIVLKATRDGAAETATYRYNPLYEATSIPASQLPNGEDDRRLVKTNEAPVLSAGLDITIVRDGQDILLGHLVVEGSRISLKIDKGRLGAPPGFGVAARSRVDANELATKLDELDIVGEAEGVTEVLKIIEPGLHDVSTITQGQISLIWGRTDLGVKMPIAFMGDGMSRLLEIMVSIATTRGGLVVIDEVENGIHHSVMPQIWEAIARAARKYDCQVVATTHSYECLQAAYEGMQSDLADDFQYIRLDKTESGIEPKHYSHSLLGAAMRSNMEVR
jgi:hypothetical protein